jgi:WD40 repeat protein
MIWGRDKPQRLYANSLFDMAISQDNQQFAFANVDLKEVSIEIWDLRSGEIVRQLHESVKDISQVHFRGLTFGKRGQLASSASGLIKIWDTSNGCCLRTLDDGDVANRVMTFSKCGQWLAFLSCDHDGGKTRIKLWDTVTGKCTSITPEQPITIRTTALSFSADSQQLAAIGHTKTTFPRTAVIYVWEVSSGKLLRKYGNEKVSTIHACFDSRIARRLHTEHGFFDTSTSFCAGVSDTTCSQTDEGNTKDAGVRVEMERMPPFSGYGLSYDMKWIMLNGQRLILIPREYRLDERLVGKRSPLIDGSRIIWTRMSLSPVLIHFTAKN